MLYSEHLSTVSSEFFWVTEILDAIGSSDDQCVERETRRASGSPVTMCVGSTFSGQELPRVTHATCCAATFDRGF